MYMRGYKHATDLGMIQTPDNAFWGLQQTVSYFLTKMLTNYWLAFAILYP